MTDDDTETVKVSRSQVRAAKALLELRGEHGVHPVVSRVAGLEYERHFVKAIQRYQPEGAVLRQTGPVASTNVQVDYRLDDGQRLLIFETRSVRTPLDTEGVRQAARWRAALRESKSTPVDVVVVSRAGFTARAERAAAAAGIRLVKWAYRDDDPALAAVIRETFGGTGRAEAEPITG